MSLLDRYVGISKKEFLSRNVIPANPNDAHYDARCSFCWGDYDDNHEGVRVLPCNHVFGADCLQTLVGSRNGNICPICRCVWYRPSLARVLFALLRDLLNHLVIQILALHHRILVLHAAAPSWLQLAIRTLVAVLKFSGQKNNTHYWAAQIIPRYKLEERNPTLNLLHLQFVLAAMDVGSKLIFVVLSALVSSLVPSEWTDEPKLVTGSMGSCICHISLSLVCLFVIRHNKYGGGCNTKRDERILLLILLISVFLAHAQELWLLWHLCYNQDPTWLSKAIRDVSPVLATVWRTVMW
ncbi:hypothetical protein OPT61_g5184 [Boeremia exigua]|uniref:Uncharacterized protein n=1 Tax=Boeremia exigua TaxID=749465 RepID=A0ACC2IBC0_9PLEO|nr:hypothetical protein OPT61_g5184 [Boeremia exigua]